MLCTKILNICSQANKKNFLSPPVHLHVNYVSVQKQESEY